ncbi:hypothetical protein DPV78_007260 [Talaromyces pinophilus]|nr:hypothetical protein DPV78_007260 [Talaromyces pinophilus]
MLINRTAKSNFITCVVIAKAINRYKIAIYRKAILNIIMLDSKDMIRKILLSYYIVNIINDHIKEASLNIYYSLSIPKIIFAYKAERELLDRYLITYYSRKLIGPKQADVLVKSIRKHLINLKEKIKQEDYSKLRINAYKLVLLLKFYRLYNIFHILLLKLFRDTNLESKLRVKIPRVYSRKYLNNIRTSKKSEILYQESLKLVKDTIAFNIFT